MKTISIIIPAYNEKKYISTVLEKVVATDIGGLQKEIIIVDDGSTDGTREILQELGDQYTVIFHQHNQGKGAALRTGFAAASGDIVAVQDADLEYNPADLSALVQPIINQQAQVVYGSRMMGNNPIGHRRYYVGNRLITWTAVVLYGKKLTDLETCYKVFSRDVLRHVGLTQNDFAFEVEFTADIFKKNIPIVELPITYAPRSFDQGKKIGWKDGVKALWLLLKYRLK